MMLTSNDKMSWVDTIWNALESYRVNIPEGIPEYDREWDDICTAMAWIGEELGLEQ